MVENEIICLEMSRFMEGTKMGFTDVKTIYINIFCGIMKEENLIEQYIDLVYTHEPIHIIMGLNNIPEEKVEYMSKLIHTNMW